jgi:hypothetical protein
MQILFVDGIGGAKIWHLSLGKRLRKTGHVTSHFSYLTFYHDYTQIQTQLAERIEQLANKGPYALIGYSFGGVLIRQVLQDMPENFVKPHHLFLLASPIRSSKLARCLQRCWLYRLATGECGQIVASPRKMHKIGLPSVPTSCIIGTNGTRGRFSPFSSEQSNDGMVAESEACPERFKDSIRLPYSHPTISASLELSQIILERLDTDGHPSRVGRSQNINLGDN